ncbi:MAG: TadE/TadG family type IV pilus assembly protein, partial [Acidimicrobiaceae bacterium]
LGELVNSSTRCCRPYSIAPTSLGSKQFTESGQATVEFALTLPFLFLFSLCVVQVGSVANDQLVLNHAAQTAARAVSLADVTPESAQQVALTAISREVNLREVQIEVNLVQDSANIALRYDREINVPVIGKLFGDFSLRSSATMPRELVNSDD